MPASIPTVKEIAWLSLVPQLAVMALLIATGFLLFGKPDGLLFGVGAYLVLSQLLRRVLPAAHRRGIRELRRGDLEQAIKSFEESYDFFSRHRWIDRFRYLTMLSSSAYSFREMAMCNVAFLHGQLGRPADSLAWYRRALQEFPTCSLARTALTFIAGIQDPPSAVRG